MGLRNRLTKLAGYLVSLAGTFISLGGDLGTAVRQGTAVISGNVVGFLIFLVGLAILVWAYRDDLKRLLGLGRSNGDWMRQIREWVHEKRGWELKRSHADKDGFEVIFKMPIGPSSSREIAVSRSKGDDLMIIGMSVQVSPGHKTPLLKLSQDERMDLRDDLIIALSSRTVDIHMTYEDGLISGYTVALGMNADADVSELAFFEAVRHVVGASDAAVIFIGRTARKAGAKP
ncbi:MAG TPA: DUF2299 family protein [Candidatus Limnocylindria bacterium]|nr:DUF2299 family protein [Candidatus Limnocylindria bacterium]